MRQRVSITQKSLDNLIFRTTRRTSRKKPIPTASQITTFDYVGVLLRAKWDRMRTAR
ncbi:NinE family protein [Mixta hanseatica]|uniref:NinE family protein n=1 Tax=Mixta hanseatica TaxID=2872648 RepID=A0ABY4RE35_9GAMM|nr:NinE family protein [Mixta hanseatica]UQY45046.1 NinE family protein [Mixta hanseatica]